MTDRRVILHIMLVWIVSGVPTALLRAESHSLFLNFQGDVNFPEFSDNPALYATSPLAAFSATQLGAGLSASDTSLLRANMLNIVRDAFAEFDVTVTDRRPLSGRYQTVGIDHGVGWPLVGLADNEDLNADDQDYARVWGGSLTQLSAFTGTGATVDRWSRGMGYAVAHEAAHNYGANHEGAVPTWYEQAYGFTTADHIMATGGNITAEQRAVNNRVFSDTSYQTLAATIGLRAKTLWNWQITNPNAEPIDGFHVQFESAHPDLTFAWESSLDPFLAPTLFHLGETAGMTRYELVWSGGAGVSGGDAFRAGISFRETNDFHILDTFLSRGGKPLTRKPAMVSYRLVQTEPGLAYLELHNESAQPVVVRNLRLRQVPRLVDLDRMTSDDLETLWTRPLGGGLHAEQGVRRPVVPSHDVQWEEDLWLDVDGVEVIDFLNLPDMASTPLNPAATAAGFTGMLPSTYVYGSAEVILPQQSVWDAATGQYVVQDLATELFFQLAGQSTTPQWSVSDFNFDGSVDAGDAGYMFEHWGKFDPIADLLADGIIDAGDAGVMFEAWTADVGPQLPEPTQGPLALLGLLAYYRANRGLARRPRGSLTCQPQ